MISVIIPVYNGVNVVSAAVNSCLGSSYVSQIIIVNDGSTDNTLSVIKRIDDSRVNVISQLNKGVSAARNTGILSVTNEYLIFLDADDILLVESLDTWIFHRSERLEKKITIFDIDRGKSNQNSKPHVAKYDLYSPGEIYKALLSVNAVVNIGRILFPLSSIGTTRFDENMVFSEDRKFWLAVFQSNKESIMRVSLSLLQYNFNPAGANITSRRKSDWEVEVLNGFLEDHFIACTESEYVLYRNTNKFLFDLETSALIDRNAHESINKIIFLIRNWKYIFYRLYIKLKFKM